MIIDTSNMRVLDIFRKLNETIRTFADNVKEVIEKHDVVAPNDEIRQLMDSVRLRHATDEKDKKENEEILKLLELLSNDKRIFSLIETESREWMEFLDEIEKRLEMDKDTLTEGELEIYERIKRVTKELKGFLREEAG